MRGEGYTICATVKAPITLYKPELIGLKCPLQIEEALDGCIQQNFQNHHSWYKR
jgi:hypothetical protein